MPDLYSLLKQFNAIGGMAQTGQSGFCLLMALWQKANELNWIDRFTMTNAELLYKAGFNCQKTLIETRHRLSQLGYFKYLKPNNRRSSGVYILNYDLLKLVDYLPQVNSDVNKEADYLPHVNSGVNSGVNSDVNSGVNSGVNINKLNQTKLTKHLDVSKDTSADPTSAPPTDADAADTTRTCDSHPQAGEADTSKSCDSRPVVTNKDIIAELVDEHYRKIPGVKPLAGDYAFMGVLYNEYGYDKVLEGLNKLQMTLAYQQIEKPLLYLKGILKNEAKLQKVPAQDKRQIPLGFTTILETVERRKKRRGHD